MMFSDHPRVLAVVDRLADVIGFLLGAVLLLVCWVMEAIIRISRR
jgi:hypothetical protein